MKFMGQISNYLASNYAKENSTEDSVVSFSEEDSRKFFDALMRGQIETVKQYLDAGMDVNVTRREQTALYVACSWIKEPILANESRLSEDETLKIRRAMISELLARGADVNLPNSDGMTPLMASAQQGDIQTMQWLLKKKADPLAESEDKSNVLFCAVVFGKAEFIYAFLDCLTPQQKSTLFSWSKDAYSLLNYTNADDDCLAALIFHGFDPLFAHPFITIHPVDPANSKLISNLVKYYELLNRLTSDPSLNSHIKFLTSNDSLVSKVINYLAKVSREHFIEKELGKVMEEVPDELQSLYKIACCPMLTRMREMDKHFDMPRAKTFLEETYGFKPAKPSIV